MDRHRTTVTREVTKPFVKIRAQVLRGSNILLSSIDSNGESLENAIDLSKQEGSNGGDGISTGTGLRGMLEGKNYRALGRVFSFVQACIN